MMQSIRSYGLTVFMAAAAAYMMFEPAWLTYENIPFPVLMQEVHRGDAIPLTVRRCNSSARTHFYDVTHSVRSDTGGSVYILPAERVRIDPGCHDSTSLVNKIPMDATFDVYHAEGIGVIEGIARSIEVPWRSASFKVIP